MHTSPLLPLLEGAGARIAPRPEAPSFSTLLTLGDVPGEYRAGREGCVLFDTSDRGLVRACGPDAAEFLHRMLSNRVHDLAPGQGSRNLLLTAKGKIRFEMELARGAAELLLSTPPGDAEALCSALATFVFSEDLELVDATETHAPLDLAGPRAAEVLTALLGAAPPIALREWRRMPWGGGEVTVTALPVVGGAGFRVDAGPEGVAALWEGLVEAGAVPAGLVVRDILRVEAGCALYGVDVDENVYPQEAKLADAFSLEKGCYTGQEVIAKIDTYGGMNKLLLPLSVDHDDPVPRGTRLLEGEGEEARDLGVVTSWAYSFVLDTGLLLAFVKRKHQDVGTTFALSDQAGHATIVEDPVG